MIADSSSPAGNTVLVSRRSAVRELASIGFILAVPIGAAVLTAQPIPNPPNRQALSVLNPERMEAVRQRRMLAKERRRTARKNSRPRKPARVARTERQQARAQRRASRS